MSTTSIKEVARRAGVSIGTVSNVLNRPELVADRTRQRVQTAIDELGFVRNESARTLRAGRSRTIALVVFDVSNPFFADVARGAEAVAEESGALVVVCNSGVNAARERRHLELLGEQRVLGVLITPVAEPSGPQLERLVRQGTHVVLVDRGAGPLDWCSVAVDDLAGGRLAGDHIAASGHRRVAFVGGPLAVRQVADRAAGLRLALAEAGVAEPMVVETDALDLSVAPAVADHLLALPERRRPTAVFCANDLVAIGLMHEVTRRGVGVPHDIAIVGYDDIDFAAAAVVPLTSVRQPRDLLGRTAARLLLDEVTRGPEHHHEQLVFAPELVVRESSNWSRRSRRRREHVDVAAG